MKQEIVRTKSKSVPPAQSKPQKRASAIGKKPAPVGERLAVGTELMFRAECELDAVVFMYVIPEFVEQPWLTVVDEYGDPEVTFKLKKEISLADLRWVASAIPDAHVIAQTLDLVGDYTGVRDMDLNINVRDKGLMPEPDVLSRFVIYAGNLVKFSAAQVFASRNARDEFEDIYALSGYPKSLLKN